MAEEINQLLEVRRGHFKLESGHHGNLWLELDRLFLRPGRLGRVTEELANRLARHDIEAICGPLSGGAFLAYAIASRLDLEFYYSERESPLQTDALHPAAVYRIPGESRGSLRGRRVAIVDDVVNAGSAVKSTLADLRACGADVRVIGALLVLGEPASRLAGDEQLSLETLGHMPNNLWESAACPLCRAHVPLVDLTAAGAPPASGGEVFGS